MRFLADPVLVVVEVPNPGQRQEFQEPAHIVLVASWFIVPVDALDVGDHEAFGFAVGKHPFSSDVAVSADGAKEYLVFGDSGKNEGRQLIHPERVTKRPTGRNPLRLIPA